MMKKFTLLALIFFQVLYGNAQIKLSTAVETYDSILSGTPLYYQFAWDDPMDEIPEYIKLPNTLKAFETVFDTMVVADGMLFFVSTQKRNHLMLVDGIGWDIADKGITDTVDYTSLSPVMLNAASNEVEWRGFGFYNEMDTLGSLESTGNLKMRINSGNTVDLIYGDFAMIRPDLCFEGFGGLRPSVTLIVMNDSAYTWYLYGDPASPSISNQELDTAFSNIPVIGQRIRLDFNKTNGLKTLKPVSLILSPNPATETIKLDGVHLTSGARYQIISPEGRITDKGVMTDHSINVTDLRTGTYILRVLDGNSVYYGKFIKN